MAELDLSAGEVEQLYETGTLDHEAARDLPCHTGLVLTSSNGSALGRVRPDKSVQLVRGDREAFGLRGRSAEQRVALDLRSIRRSASCRSAAGPAPASPRWRC